MKKSIIYLSLSIATSLVLISCSGDGPKATVEKMRQAACNSDIEEFFSYIDKDDYEKIYRNNEYDEYIESLEEKPSTLAVYVDRLYYVNSQHFGYDPDGYFLERNWTDFNNDVEKGESSELCQLEIIGPGEKRNSLIVETPFQGKLIWIFKHSWGRYKLIELDTLDDEEQEARAIKLVEELRQAGCKGDVEEFFSYIDKEAIARNFKKDIVKKLKTQYSENYSGWDKVIFYMNYYSYINSIDDSDPDTALSHQFVMDLYENSLWELFKKEVEKGENGGACTMKMEDPKDKTDDFTVDDTSFTGSWTISTSLSDWNITGVNLDSYVTQYIEDNWEGNKK